MLWIFLLFTFKNIGIEELNCLGEVFGVFEKNNNNKIKKKGIRDYGTP